MSTIRTFIAVEMSDEVRDGAARLIARLAQTNVKVKWVERQNMHLTLKFLGDVPQEETAAICRATTDAVRKIDRFDAECCGAGAFPHPSRPKTIWLGLGEGSEQFARLHKAIDTALAKLGFPREHRKYHPHLTLGRVRGGGAGIPALADLLRQNGGCVAGVSPVSEATVFASQLKSAGPVYTVLGRAQLGLS